MKQIDSRFINPVNLLQFSVVNEPLLVGPVTVNKVPEGHILRVLVQSPYSKGLKLTSDVQWLEGAVHQAKEYQAKKIGIVHPYIYLTMRSGIVKCARDGEWHVDGFSVRYTHLPEANYVVVFGDTPTEYAAQSFDFPPDFDPLAHNIHRFFQKRIDVRKIKSFEPGKLYLVDPYVVHRRPEVPPGTNRCFARISFTPIEVPDINNAVNPLINTSHYTYDGIKDFRDQLKDYDQYLKI
jgi:hypothetical protein